MKRIALAIEVEVPDDLDLDSIDVSRDCTLRIGTGFESASAERIRFEVHPDPDAVFAEQAEAVERASGGQYAVDTDADTWIDRSRPEWPREVAQAHLDADADHPVAPDSAFSDELSDNCATCGLASTSDGKRHGFDAS